MKENEAKTIYERVLKMFGITFADFASVSEQTKEGVVKFVVITLRIKID
jgi:hypothetical protein